MLDSLISEYQHLYAYRQSCFANATPSINWLNGNAVGNQIQGAYLDHSAYICDGASANCYVYRDHSYKWTTIAPLSANRNMGFGIRVPTHHANPKFQRIQGLNYGWEEHWKWWFAGQGYNVPCRVFTTSSSLKNFVFLDDHFLLSFILRV